MRAGVFPWLVAVPFLVVVGCFEAGTLEIVPGGSGGSSSSSTASAGSTGSAGGMGSSSSSASSGAGGMGSSSSSSGAGGSGGNPVVCPSIPDTAAMVLIDDVTDYCIDSTEVSNAQYKAWLLKNPDGANQPMECAANSFVPMSGSPPADDKPVVNVDWCDAYGYCKANGKRLCGKIGGGPNSWADFAQPGLSQWLGACSKAGTQTYPYGNTYDIPACNVGDAQPDGGPSVSWPVGSAPTCEGGYPGIFDMSGNVWEWEDSCDPNSTKCRRRGGSYTSDATNVTCAVGGTLDRLSFASNGGFRCCADLP